MATLQLAIDARHLLAKAKQVERGLSGIRSTASRTFSTVKSAANIALGPLKLMIGVTASLKASMVALGAASIGAAGDYEMFRQQLLTVIRSKKDADRAFAESIEFSVKTPFTPDEIVETRLALESVGVRGGEAVERVAEAAAAMNRNVVDVARAVKSMEVEPIRNLGIMMDELYKRGVAKDFRQSTEAFRDAQGTLMEIFEERFGGGIERMALTWQGLVSTLKGAVKDVRAEFGEGFLDESKLIVNDLIEASKGLKQYAGEAGREFGDEMMRARAYVLAGFDTAMKMAEQIKEVLKQDSGIGEVLLEAFRLGTTVLGKGIVTAFEVSLPLWKTIGTILGQGVLDAVMQSGIPGADYARGKAIQKNLSGMSASELRKMSIARGYDIDFTTPDYRTIKGGGYQQVGVKPKSAEALAADLAKEIQKLSIEEQLAFAQFDPGRAIADSIEASRTKMAASVKSLGADMVAELQAFENNLAKASGTDVIDLTEDFKGNLQARLDEGEKMITQWRQTLGAEIQTAGADGARAVGAETENLAAQTALTTLDIAQAYARMYDEMDARSAASFEARRRVLDEEIKEYQKVVKDTTVLAEYRARKLEELAIEQARSSDAVLDGFAAGLQDVEREMTTLGEIGYQTAFTIRDELAGAFDTLTMEGASWRDAMTGFFKDVGQAWLRMLNQMVAEALMTQAMQPAFNWIGAAVSAWASSAIPTGAPSPGLGQPGVSGVHVPHGGGIMGKTNFHQRVVSPGLFTHAPRFHSGLGSDEMAAILRRDEHVLTPNQMNTLVKAAASGPSNGEVHIHMNNQSGVRQEITKQQEYMFSDQRHIDITLQALETDSRLRRAVKQAVRR